MSETPETSDAPLTRRELRELERNRALAASAALAELAAQTPSSDGAAGPAERSAWRPPAAPASSGPALTRRELRQRNVEVEPVRLAVPSQASAPTARTPDARPASGVAPIPVSTVREHADDQDHLPVSGLAAAVQGRRQAMRDAAASAVPSRPVEAAAAGGLALEVRPSVELEAPAVPSPQVDSAAEVGDAPQGVSEPSVVTDGFGMPAILMNAPVLPALRPIEEIEAELAHRALGGSAAGDRPASPDPDEPVDPVESAGPADGVVGFEPGTTASAAPDASGDGGGGWQPGEWEPGVWDLSAGLEPDEPEVEAGRAVLSVDSEPADSGRVELEPTDREPGDREPGAPELASPALDPAGPAAAVPALGTFEPARASSVPSPRTVASQRHGIEQAAAMAAPAASTRRRSPARRPQPASDDVMKVPAGRWQAVYGAWIGAAAIVVWALGPIALVLGLWALVQARAEGYGRGRPVTAIVCGALGTIFGVLFLLVSPG